MPQVCLTVNGKQQTVEVEGRTLLVELLRERLGLTGTHIGCDTSQCGACVVLIDGSEREILHLAGAAGGWDGSDHHRGSGGRRRHAAPDAGDVPGAPRAAMRLLHAGHGDGAIDLVQSHPEGLSEHQIREGLEGNLCRCTGYHNIVKAIAAAWPLMHGEALQAAAE